MALDEIRNTKIKKVEELRKSGTDPYPASSSRTNSVKEAIDNYDEWKESRTIILAGRILARREHGGSTFFDIDDGSGNIQAYIKEDMVGSDEYKHFQESIDRGDFIEIEGQLKDTKRQEKTIYV